MLFVLKSGDVNPDYYVGGSHQAYGEKQPNVCNTLEKHQEIELSKIEVISATPKKMNSFISVNNIRIDTALCSEVEQSIVSTFLQKVIPLAKQIEVVSEQ